MIRGTGKPHSYPTPPPRGSPGGLGPLPRHHEEPPPPLFPREDPRQEARGRFTSPEPQICRGLSPPLPRGGRRGAGGRGTRVPSHVAAAAGQTMGAHAAFLLLLLTMLGFVSSRAGPSRGAGWVESKTKRKQRHKKAALRPLATQRLAGGWRWWRRGAKPAPLPSPGGTHAHTTPKRTPSISKPTRSPPCQAEPKTPRHLGQLPLLPIPPPLFGGNPWWIGAGENFASSHHLLTQNAFQCLTFTEALRVEGGKRLFPFETVKISIQ